MSEETQAMAGQSSEWETVGYHVLQELKRITEGQERIEAKCGALEVSVGKLHVKSGVWGALGGAVTILVLVLTLLVKQELLPLRMPSASASPARAAEIGK